MRVPCGCCMPARLRTACLHTASTLHVCVVGRPVLRAPCTRDALRDLRDPCCMPACLRTACAVRKDANLQKRNKVFYRSRLFVRSQQPLVSSSPSYTLLFVLFSYIGKTAKLFFFSRFFLLLYPLYLLIFHSTSFKISLSLII